MTGIPAAAMFIRYDAPDLPELLSASVFATLSQRLCVDLCHGSSRFDFGPPPSRTSAALWSDSCAFSTESISTYAANTGSGKSSHSLHDPP